MYAITVGDTRFDAYWLISYGNQPDPSEFDPDAVEYGNKEFSDLQAAIEFVQQHDMNKEGKVYSQRAEMDHDPILGEYVLWIDDEITYCYPDGTTETVSATI